MAVARPVMTLPDLTGLPRSPLDLPPAAPEDRVVALLVSLLEAAELDRAAARVVVRLDDFDVTLAHHLLDDYRARRMRLAHHARRTPR